MNETISLETVAALLNIPTGTAANNERLGTLPFVRFGDGFITTDAAVTALRGDKNFLRKLATENAAHDLAVVAPVEAIQRLSKQREAQDRKDRDDAGRARYKERVKREGTQKARLEVAANGIVRRA
jgi:hypothetical protein